MNNLVIKKIIVSILLIISSIFILFGTIRKDYIDMYNKAKLICFECIVIG